MNILKLVFVAVLALGMTGCFLGDRGASKMVSVGLASQSISAGDANVQTALAVIDRTLLAAGLTRVPGDLTPKSDGAIIHYEGGNTRGCSVSLVKNRVFVVFVEGYQRHSSQRVVQIAQTLKTELAATFGPKNVAIE